jgi:putative phage-type endonuclease
LDWRGLAGRGRAWLGAARKGKARRFVAMNEAERLAWLERRRSSLGSSDAAAVCGLSRFRTPLHVYLDKKGLLSEEETGRQKWGRMLEEVVAQAYVEETGQRVSMPPKEILYHPEETWLSASLDRVVYAESPGRGTDGHGEERLGPARSGEACHGVASPGQTGPGQERHGQARQGQDFKILEIKTAAYRSQEWGSSGTDEIPREYVIQLQHQLMVTGAREAEVAVLFGGQELRVYNVAYEPSLAGVLLDVERSFWEHHVIRGVAPEPDWRHPLTPTLISRMHEGDPEDREVGLVGEGLTEALRYRRVRELMAELSKEGEHLRAQLLYRLGGAAVGVGPGFRLRHRVVRRKGYTVEPGVYSVLRFEGDRSEE